MNGGVTCVILAGTVPTFGNVPVEEVRCLRAAMYNIT